MAIELERAAAVRVEVYDAGGRLVALPLDGVLLPAGRTERLWRPRGLAAGHYFVRARVADRDQVRTITWLGQR